jgi:hypothetical protein
LNLSKAFYLTAESDVGGFGIGSDVAGQAYAALGCQITRSLYSEDNVADHLGGKATSTFFCGRKNGALGTAPLLTCIGTILI